MVCKCLEMKSISDLKIEFEVHMDDVCMSLKTMFRIDRSLPPPPLMHVARDIKRIYKWCYVQWERDIIRVYDNIEAQRGSERYRETHKDTERYIDVQRCAKRYREAQRAIESWAQVHIGTVRYIEAERGTKRHREIHRGADRYSEIHRDREGYIEAQIDT